MFTNLIESSSHKSEFKRRGSFFLFTTATYFLLFVIVGVMSIYAYDARLEQPSEELVVLVNPAMFDAPKPEPTRNSAPPKSTPGKPNLPIREIAMAPVDMPTKAPDSVSATPNKNLPIPAGNYVIGNKDSDPGGVVGPVGPASNGGNGIGTSNQPTIDIGVPPVAAPVEKQKPTILRKSIINGEAISLPKPPYPPNAKQMRIQGVVSVQVLIDETGKVVSAKVVSGSPALSGAAQRAAFNARFSPTTLHDQPVKVSGVITYNFVLQ